MDFSIFSQILSQIAVMALVIGIITYCIRYVIELTSFKALKLWNSVILPGIPFILGFIFGWYHLYGLSWELGTIAGFSSSYMFSVFKSYLKVAQEKLEIEEKEEINKEEIKEKQSGNI